GGPGLADPLRRPGRARRLRRARLFEEPAKLGSFSERRLPFTLSLSKRQPHFHGRKRRSSPARKLSENQAGCRATGSPTSTATSRDTGAGSRRRTMTDCSNESTSVSVAARQSATGPRNPSSRRPSAQVASAKAFSTSRPLDTHQV